MAKFNVVGFDAVERALMRREKAAVEAVPKMLEAGAEVLIKAQCAEIERMDIVNWHDMADSLKATAIKNDDIRATVEVYPQGKDRQGISNATKAFVHQYGKSNLPARPWMTSANEKCAGEVHEAMRAVWEAMTNE